MAQLIALGGQIVCVKGIGFDHQRALLNNIEAQILKGVGFIGVVGEQCQIGNSERFSM